VPTRFGEPHRPHPADTSSITNLAQALWSSPQPLKALTHWREQAVVDGCNAVNVLQLSQHKAHRDVNDTAVVASLYAACFPASAPQYLLHQQVCPLLPCLPSGLEVRRA
jgi:hypothetical protein